MISSTVRDLPQHRGEVKEACLQQEMFPDMMEHLPSSATDAIRISLEKVDGADIYLGIFGHRYGHIPEGYNTSITEMEYNRAVERNISRIIFIMHDEHPITIRDVDFENRDKLDALKERLCGENIVNFFKSPIDLRGLVINSLAHFRYKRDEVKLKDADRLRQFIVEHGEMSEMLKLGLKMIGPNDSPDPESAGGGEE
jgi:hypothetical protein